MNRFKNALRSFGIPGIIVILQYAAVVLFNFLYTDNAIDSDTAKLLRHSVEMGRNHTLNIPEWIHTTTMEWDTSALLSAPIYSLTHNIYLSTAVSNTVITALLICLIIRLFDRFGLSIKTALKSCTLLLIPYAFGMLDYYTLLMFGGAQYVFRIMIPILLLCILKTSVDKRIGIENILLSVLAVILILIASVSSGLYITVSCVLPVAALVVFDALMYGKREKYGFLVAGAAFVVSAIGSIISIRSGEASFGNGMSLLRWYDLRYYIDCVAEGFFRLMGAMPGAVQDESIAVFSARGIAFLFKLLIALTLIPVLVSGCRHVLFAGKKDPDPVLTDREQGAGNAFDPGDDIRFWLCGIALINFIIVAVCETRYSSLNSTLEYRYLLPVTVPLLLCCVPQIEVWQNGWSKTFRTVLWALLTAGLVYTTCICYTDAHNSLDPYAYCNDIIAYAEDSGYDTVIFLDDRVSAECCRIMDMSREYEAYSSNGCMDIVDYYAAAEYSDFYNDRHLLFAVTGTSLADTIGSDKAMLYTYRDSILWFDIYEAQEFALGF